MIPKKLHYCWFGGKRIPKLYERCISTWGEKVPDFEVNLWNEDNVEFNTPFLQAALHKKQWAFIADYIRMRVTHEHGGIYLDADFEVIKDLSPLLNNECFVGLESRNRPTSGIFGCVKGHVFPQKCMEIMDLNFSKKEAYLIAPEVAMKAIYDLSDPGIKIYPEDYFYPYNPYDLERSSDNLMFSDITNNTFAIHHWGKGWKQPFHERLIKSFKRVAGRIS